MGVGPKQSLKELPQPQDSTAAAWKLNLIETIHWASFPLGFCILHYIFVNAPKIGTYVGGYQTRVFFLLLGLFSRVGLLQPFSDVRFSGSATGPSRSAFKWLFRWVSFSLAGWHVPWLTWGQVQHNVCLLK
jgi:hypothetical protein